ncbi:DUF397 domain-containing protein [Streptomyces sp. NPDC002793]|uniref:DUF397 domain-containing protein n=1 Tax=Streptomyces sp. NPDC002793 TaxID=3154432 RepID=UPI00332A94F1
MPAYQWRTSSYSGDASNCVNLLIAPDGTIRLRDSKVPQVIVATGPHALQHFIKAVVSGAFERPEPSATHTSG